MKNYQIWIKLWFIYIIDWYYKNNIANVFFIITAFCQKEEYILYLCYIYFWQHLDNPFFIPWWCTIISLYKSSLYEVYYFLIMSAIEWNWHFIETFWFILQFMKTVKSAMNYTKNISLHHMTLYHIYIYFFNFIYFFIIIINIDYSITNF